MDMIEEIREKLNRPLIFVGLMGAGKSTVGRHVAKNLGLGFTDSDTLIVEREKKSIEEIFAEEGEARFRDLERKTIADILDEHQNSVIGIGGGAFINNETRALLKEKAISVFLKADIEVLKKRVGDGRGRPLFKDKKVEDVLNDLILARYPIYEEADITVESCDENAEETAQKVMSALYKHLSNA